MMIGAIEYDHGFPLMGTDIRLLVSSPAPSGPATEVLMRRVRARLEEIHGALTRFDPDSELNLLNGHAGEWVPVSGVLLAGVEAAVRAAQRSGGLVDPTLTRHLERAGYATSHVGRSPAPVARALACAPERVPAAPDPAARWQRIQIDGVRSAVRLPRGVRLDLGGSAKGMAVDVAARLLGGTPAFAVDGGGDVRLGGRSPAPRVVEIAHPLNDGVAHRFTVTTGAVATSGLGSRVWATDFGARFAHHLIDPSRGAPAWTGVIQATALAPTTLEAETLAKMAVLRGPLGGRAALRRHGGALILDDGALILVGEAISGAGEPAIAQRRSA
jgi:thiamine biosynthesis lipoprotein